MAIERFTSFIQEELQRDDLTDKEREFLEKQRKIAIDEQRGFSEYESKRLERVERARALGQRMREAYRTIATDETRVRDLIRMFNHSPEESHAAAQNGDHSPLIDFVTSLTPSEKGLINSSLNLVFRKFWPDTGAMTIGNLSMRIDELKEERLFGSGKKETSRLTLLQAAFPKPPVPARV